MRRTRSATRFAGGALLLASLAFGSLTAVAQSPTATTPMASPAALDVISTPVHDAAGTVVGTLHVSEADLGVTFTVHLDPGALPAGDHGIHIHETGSCDVGADEAFAMAGGHFDPAGTSHGGPDGEPRHAGDLGNLTAGADGSAEFTITIDSVTLMPEAADSLRDADGSALIIHADPDDLTTDPSGNSGARVLCAVIAPERMATPMASPASSPIASPSTMPMATPDPMSSPAA